MQGINHFDIRVILVWSGIILNVLIFPNFYQYPQHIPRNTEVFICEIHQFNPEIKQLFSLLYKDKILVVYVLRDLLYFIPSSTFNLLHKFM